MDAILTSIRLETWDVVYGLPTPVRNEDPPQSAGRTRFSPSS